MTSLAGHSAIVTGAAQGLGLAIARAFLDQGARVCMVDLQEDKVTAAAAELDPTSERAIPAPADVTSRAAVAAMVQRAVDAFGAVDVLVNNAGGSGSRQLGPIDEVDEEAWERTIRVNLTSAFLCSQAVVPLMRERRRGRILNFSSVIARGSAGPLGTVGARLPYATAKAGIQGFTAQLGKDLAPDGICVNAISPGLILPEPGSRVRDAFDGLAPEIRERMLSGIPMGRPGTADEIAWLAVCLAAPGASYISGTTIDVSGGGF